MAEVFKVPPIRTNSVPELNKWAVEVNRLFARVSERLNDRKQKLTLTGDLDAAGFRIKNIGAPRDEDDPVTVGRIQDLLDELDAIDPSEETSESDEEGLGAFGGRAGRKGKKGRQRTSRFRRIIDDEIGQALIDAIPTVAPPNVAAVSALGTTTDPVKFALSDHTHGGVLGAPPAGGAAGEVAFFTSSFEIGSDPAFFWDDTNKRLSVGGQETDITINGTTVGMNISAHSATATNEVQFGCHKHSDTATANPVFVMARSRGSEASETVVADNDIVGQIFFVAYDGTDYAISGRMIMQIDEPTPSSTAMGSEFFIETTPRGAVTGSTRFHIGTSMMRLLGSSLTTGTRRIDMNDLTAITIDGIRTNATAYGVDLSLTNAAAIMTALEVGSKDYASNTWTITTALVSAVGAGARIFSFNPLIKNSASTAIADMGAWEALIFRPTYQADGAACTVAAVRPFVDNTSFNIINGGTLAVTELTTVTSSNSIGASVTVTTRRGLRYRNFTSTGTVTTSVAVEIEDQTVGTLVAGVRSAIASGTGKWFLASTGTAASSIGGVVFIGTTTLTVASARLHVQEQTINNEVLRLESVATNDDPNYRVFHGRVATTDATVTTLISFTLTAARAYLIEARVVAHRTGGAAGAADDSAAYVVYAGAKHTGGVAALITAVGAAYTDEDQAAWNATIDVDGANAIRVRVTGAADNNITWHCTLIVQDVGT